MRWNALEQLGLYVCNARAVHSLPLPDPHGSVPIGKPSQASLTGDPIGAHTVLKPNGRADRWEP